jgi:hypothetical protein
MKIISGWKDYYDHVAHMYDGGDPKVIYNRDYVVPDRVSSGSNYEDTLAVNRVWSPSIPHSMDIVNCELSHVQKHEFNALIVMDRVFILERHGDINEFGNIANVRKDWHITSRPILGLQYGGPYALLKLGESLPDSTPRYQKNRMDELMRDRRNDRFIYPQGRKHDEANALCAFAKAPVFVVHGNRMPIIMGRTPKLSSLGMPGYLDPQQLYQELAMFVGNVLNPVEQPPSNMKDIEKVASHGFDKKVSFRHRK